MAKKDGSRPRGRFSRSGHTTHTPRVPPAVPPDPSRGYASPPASGPPPGYGPPYSPPPNYGPPPNSGPPPGYRPPPGYGPPPGSSAPPNYGPPPPDGYPADPYVQPTDHRTDPHGQAAGSRRAASTESGAAHTAATLGRATLSGTNRAARAVTRKVITASKSDGAAESGLTALIWNQVLSYGADAMITVALAGTVFFGASAHAQRGNVLLYLLITMAPFAVVAPVIGPVLDRLQHGRRWTMAATGIVRAVLALIMAAHSNDLLVLYPCALGSLVCSKAYAVVRAAAAPRLVPPTMTLTAANAKITIFGLGSTMVLGGFVGLLIKATGSYSLGLVVTAIAFGGCAVLSFKLPAQVDSAPQPAERAGEVPRPAAQAPTPVAHRLLGWARRGFGPRLVVALQAEAAQRLLSGFLAIYLAFYVETTSHGFAAAVDLALVIGAAGLGNFAGTALGTRLKNVRPQLIITVCIVAAAAACLLGALLFSIVVAAAVMLVGSVTNAQSKIALDAMIQHRIAESLRSSAFARSETFLQLAWVLGAAIGVGLPSSSTRDGMIAFVVATVLVGAAAVVVVLRNRAIDRRAATHSGDTRPLGNVAPRTVD